MDGLFVHERAHSRPHRIFDVDGALVDFLLHHGKMSGKGRMRSLMCLTYDNIVFRLLQTSSALYKKPQSLQ